MIGWSEAFAQQASSDLDVYDFLTKSNFPVCHRLHYLQMWLEKLCKAYAYRPNEPTELELQRTHRVVFKKLPKLVGTYWIALGFKGRPNRAGLCREIDRGDNSLKRLKGSPAVQ